MTQWPSAGDVSKVWNCSFGLFMVIVLQSHFLYEFRVCLFAPPKIIYFPQKVILAANALLTLYVYARLTKQSAHLFRAVPSGQIDILHPWLETGVSLSTRTIFTLVGVTCLKFCQANIVTCNISRQPMRHYWSQTLSTCQGTMCRQILATKRPLSFFARTRTSQFETQFNWPIVYPRSERTRSNTWCSLACGKRQIQMTLWLLPHCQLLWVGDRLVNHCPWSQYHWEQHISTTPCKDKRGKDPLCSNNCCAAA